MTKEKQISEAMGVMQHPLSETKQAKQISLCN